MSNDGADDFFVEFNQLVAFRATNHGHDEDFFDLLFFFHIYLKVFWFPTSLYSIFELDEGCLLDSFIDVVVVYDFHESHAVA